MILGLFNLTTRVVSSSPEELAWLAALLSFKDESKAFVRNGAFVERVEPPEITLLVDGCFPAGLTGKVCRDAVASGVSVTVMDRRVMPHPVDLSVKTDWLRPYQRECAERALAKTRGILKLPTGAGKTEIVVAISMLVPEATCLMIAPEKDLMHNAARRYELRTDEKSGRIGDGIWEPAEHFTAATFQTLVSELRSGSVRCRRFLDTIDVMFIDEVHTLPADTNYSVAQNIPAYWRIGMSGTPLARGDKKSLFSIASTGSIIYELKPQFLIDAGFLSTPRIKLISVKQSGAPSLDSYRKAYTSLIVDSTLRNRYLTSIAVTAAKPGLLFVREKKHGFALVKMLKARGLRTEFIWGDKSTPERDAAIKKLEWGDLDIIVCSKVFVTGTDIPSLRSIINGMGGKSEIETLQRLGRGMRVTPDKTEFELWDVKDIAEPMTSPNKWNHKHSLERARAYSEQGYEVVTVSDFVP